MLPPISYSPTGEWSEQDIKDFFAFDVKGVTVQWLGCTPELLAAKEKLVARLDELNWTISYTSAYRPLIYQAHFYDIKYGDASKTQEGKDDAIKHGLSDKVSYPSSTSPHIAGIAFDAIVINEEGVVMNGRKFIDDDLLKIANECGLDINIPGDYVHFQLQND